MSKEKYDRGRWRRLYGDDYIGGALQLTDKLKEEERKSLTFLDISCLSRAAIGDLLELLGDYLILRGGKIDKKEG